MLGEYEIVDYELVIDGVSEIRQNIVYYDFDGNEYITERFYGEIREGYTEKI